MIDRLIPSNQKQEPYAQFVLKLPPFTQMFSDVPQKEISAVPTIRDG